MKTPVLLVNSLVLIILQAVKNLTKSIGDGTELSSVNDMKSFHAV